MTSTALAMKVLIFGNSGSGKSSLAAQLAEARPWEPHKYESQAAQDAMLDHLQAWVAGYYTRQDQWSYHAHRRIFDAFTGRKGERGP